MCETGGGPRPRMALAGGKPLATSVVGRTQTIGNYCLTRGRIRLFHEGLDQVPQQPRQKYLALCKTLIFVVFTQEEVRIGYYYPVPVRYWQRATGAARSIVWASLLTTHFPGKFL